MPFKFSADALAELRAIGHDDELIAKLETAARRYGQDVVRAARSSARIPEAKRLISRRRRQAQALRQTLDKLDKIHPLVRLATQPHRPSVEALARRSPTTQTRPVDNDRRALEYAIGHTLHRQGVRLTTPSDGKLGRTLATVLTDVGVEHKVDRLKQICRRVRDEVAAALAG